MKAICKCGRSFIMSPMTMHSSCSICRAKNKKKWASSLPTAEEGRAAKVDSFLEYTE